MNTMQNMALLKELIRCEGNLYLWQYDAQGQLVNTNCPDAELLDTAFTVFGCKEHLLHRLPTDIHPILLSGETGLCWFADFEWAEDLLKHSFVIGPVFFHETPDRSVEKILNRYDDPRLTITWKSSFLKAIRQLPVISSGVAIRYALMMHFCLTSERLTAADLLPPEAGASQTEPPPTRERLLEAKLTEDEIIRETALFYEDPSADRARDLRTEQALLHIVRSGDMNYKETYNRLLLADSAPKLKSSEPLRRVKTENAVFISLVSRAAIEGGLPIDEALAMESLYLQRMEDSPTEKAVAAVQAAMFSDFVQRVHRSKNRPKLSYHIQRCCDYIEMNLDKKILAKDLAALVGYTEYYLSQRFREETGLFINDYIKQVKIDRARLLLISTDLSIQKISEQLGFNTRSYFTQVFREVVGIPPVAYRERHRR
ncbi:MAG: helix-turn-helix transcriptional regulator [Oscillospiraceae bacterium]|nr:helix-turn-helix transcriptional regulator [Oscillospiraceae bacterium]